MGIGPSTKETTLQHFRDPLLDVIQEDTDVDLAGIIIVGTPDDNVDKIRVGTRAAIMAECIRADGAIITADGWGNSDVDYVNTCEQLGIRGIAVTGLKFIGRTAGFVVTNNYLDGIFDINKSESGTETDIVGQNNYDARDCRKALVVLKAKMAKNSRNR
ncbi:D-proline reductase (dithiol) PrdE [Eubacterium pyruvativorans]|uniref:D-proline reductase (Dithiol) PrdE n=1 Tax=Eubacterium pyruvativorans TaxID=155865 RepID=A0A1I7HX78_9FIRM|nr:glycine/sarcosine/betaine reductase component B subunit [Eubacterium pyruvativorans]SFO34397.1 D-proline reductase (dithiol) PrdE [Eubacterium pyruvativorans]SFU65257.1 D-proline reductase (dithiol) PrdE [Eubacterium pyruvativorans]HAT82032.1 proline reductase [Eubacterium sp.]